MVEVIGGEALEKLATKPKKLNSFAYLALILHIFLNFVHFRPDGRTVPKQSMGARSESDWESVYRFLFALDLTDPYQPTFRLDGQFRASEFVVRVVVGDYKIK